MVLASQRECNTFSTGARHGPVESGRFLDEIAMESKPAEALDDEKPIELIARGEYRRVLGAVSAIEYPGAA